MTIKPTFTFNIVGVVHEKSVNRTPRIMFTESRWTIMVSFIFIFSPNEHEFCNRTQMYAIFRKLTPVNFENNSTNCWPPPYRVEKILSTKLFLGFWKIEYILRRMVYTYFRYDPLWPHNDLSEKLKKYNFWPKICNFLQNIKNLGGKWNNLKNYEYKAIILANLAAGLTFVAKIMFKLSKSIKNWQF